MTLKIVYFAMIALSRNVAKINEKSYHVPFFTACPKYLKYRRKRSENKSSISSTKLLGLQAKDGLDVSSLFKFNKLLIMVKNILQ